jgi:hypothetical protein
MSSQQLSTGLVPPPKPPAQTEMQIVEWSPPEPNVDAKIGLGDIHIAAEGVGPDDGFTGYKPTASNGTRPRWGDYGAAATDGDSIWIASEYVNQTCTLTGWLTSNFRCGNTRTQLANWGTRISKVVP